MKLLSSIDVTLNPSAVNEVTYNINFDHIDTQWMQPDNSLHNQCKTHSNLLSVPKTSILMPGNVQIHRQVSLSDVKISKEIKVLLYNLAQNMIQLYQNMIMI